MECGASIISKNKTKQPPTYTANYKCFKNKVNSKYKIMKSNEFKMKS